MRSAPATPTNNREAAASLRASLRRSHTDSSPSSMQPEQKKKTGKTNWVGFEGDRNGCGFRKRI